MTRLFPTVTVFAFAVVFSTVHFSCSNNDDEDFNVAEGISGEWSMVYLNDFDCADPTNNKITDLRDSPCIVQDGEEICHDYDFIFGENGEFLSKALLEKVLPDGSRIKVVEFETAGTYTVDNNKVTICEDFGSLGEECINWTATISGDDLTVVTTQLIDDGCMVEMRGIRSN